MANLVLILSNRRCFVVDDSDPFSPSIKDAKNEIHGLTMKSETGIGRKYSGSYKLLQVNNETKETLLGIYYGDIYFTEAPKDHKSWEIHVGNLRPTTRPMLQSIRVLKRKWAKMFEDGVA